MKKSLIFAIIFGLIFLTFILLVFNQKSAVVEFRNHKFKAELARTQEEHSKGLAGRKKLLQSAGMLFIYPDYAPRTFSMRDMNFPIDIVWIKDNFVIGCSKNVQIEAADGSFTQINSIGEPNYVLEINANKCDEFNIKTGSGVDIKIY